MRYLRPTTAIALTLLTAATACGQTTSRPAQENNMKTRNTEAPQVETATFAVG